MTARHLCLFGKVVLFCASFVYNGQEVNGMIDKTSRVVALFLTSALFFSTGCSTDCDDDTQTGNYSADEKGGIGNACSDGSSSS